MSRVRFARWAVPALLLAATGSPPVAAGAPARPNVILMMADDLGWGDVGFNGNAVIRTPHLDAMAKAGLTFTRFYAAAPVCSPTRGSCLTGRHPFRYGVYNANGGHIRPGEITLAELLKEQGYATGHFGKWHLGTLTTAVKDSNRGGPGGREHLAPPWRHGFDVCFSTEAKVPTWDPMRKPKGETGGTWWDPAADPREAEDFGTRYWDERGEAVTENLSGDDSRVIMDRAIPFIERAAKQKKPFLAVIWFHAPHLPVVAGPQYTALYAGHPKHHRHYYGCVTAMDEQVGRLRQELARLGVADDTMLWFCADNGPEGSAKFPGSAGPFRGRKRSLHEGGVRVPGVLVWPARVRPGSVTDFPAVTSDYLPTVLAALGVRYPDDRPLDGIDLLPVIDGRVKERDRPIGFQTRDAVSWVTQRYKLIGPADGEHARKKPKRADAPREWMLFDLLKDPGETADLAAKHPEIVEQMKSELAAWRESCARSDRGEDYK